MTNKYFLRDEGYKHESKTKLIIEQSEGRL